MEVTRVVAQEEGEHACRLGIRGEEEGQEQGQGQRHGQGHRLGQRQGVRRAVHPAAQGEEAIGAQQREAREAGHQEGPIQAGSHGRRARLQRWLRRSRIGTTGQPNLKHAGTVKQATARAKCDRRWHMDRVTASRHDTPLCSVALHFACCKSLDGLMGWLAMTPAECIWQQSMDVTLLAGSLALPRGRARAARVRLREGRPRVGRAGGNLARRHDVEDPLHRCWPG